MQAKTHQSLQGFPLQRVLNGDVHACLTQLGLVATRNYLPCNFESNSKQGTLVPFTKHVIGSYEVVRQGS